MTSIKSSAFSKWIIHLISFKWSVRVGLIFTASVIVFHLGVFLNIIPSNIVWGGRVESKENLQVAELVSLSVNILLLLTILFKAQYIRLNTARKAIQPLLWVFFVIFVLNTIGNLFAVSLFERTIFTALTSLMALICLRMALESTSAEKL